MLETMCSELEGIRNMSVFYEQWCLDNSKLRKLFAEGIIIVESRRRGHIETMIEKCEGESASLKAMKLADDSVGKRGGAAKSKAKAKASNPKVKAKAAKQPSISE